jgi:hypothetical protein
MTTTADKPCYAILNGGKWGKIKTPYALYKALAHGFREQDTPNANPERTPDNEILTPYKSVKDAILRYNEILEKCTKVRKPLPNAVYANSWVVAASPSFKDKTPEEQKSYFDAAFQYFKDWYGEENILAAIIHRDETTPHMHIYVAPVSKKTGELSSYSYLGGSKNEMGKRLTDFVKKCCEPIGLKRGKYDADSHHLTIREYYNNTAEMIASVRHEVDAILADVEKREKSLSETSQMKLQYLLDSIKDVMTPEEKEDFNQRINENLARKAQQKQTAPSFASIAYEAGFGSGASKPNGADYSPAP